MNAIFTILIAFNFFAFALNVGVAIWGNPSPYNYIGIGASFMGGVMMIPIRGLSKLHGELLERTRPW